MCARIRRIGCRSVDVLYRKSPRRVSYTDYQERVSCDFSFPFFPFFFLFVIRRTRLTLARHDAVRSNVGFFSIHEAVSPREMLERRRRVFLREYGSASANYTELYWVR